MEKIGFIGLGAMGTAMAWNIKKGGYPLHVWNRSYASTVPFREGGVAVCESPREVAGRADVVVIMVTGPKALTEVVEGPQGVAAGLTPGKTVINMSTVSPDATEGAAAKVTGSGAAFVDAPVSGTVKPAREGSLVILGGAQSKDLDRVMPLLKTMGREVVRCGGVGQGTRMKLVLNLMLGNMMQALAEAMVLGKSFELDPQALLKALGGGALGAPMYQAKGKAITDGNFSSQFPVHLMLKDLNLLLEGAGQAGVPLPQSSSTRECFVSAMAKGYGQQDMAAVVKVLEDLTGRTVRD